MSIIDLEKYKQRIEHKIGMGESTAEACNAFAYQIDGSNGLSVDLGFKNGQISQADYVLFDKVNNQAQIIELSDLSKAIRLCLIAEKLSQDNIQSFADEIGKSTNKATKLLKMKIWYEVIGEIKNKWFGSIAILERYCRRDNYINDLSYSLVIVVKNSQDPRALDSFRLKLIDLEPILGEVKVVKTEHLEQLLILKLI